MKVAGVPSIAVHAAAVLCISACSGRPDGSGPKPAPEPPDRLTFAFYNVENLFDPADDPAIEGDDEFTPAGPNRWSGTRLDRKLDALARVLRAIDEQRGADVIGLCELENRHVLDLLVDEYLPRGTYAVVHTDSRDARGIDVALLYRTGAMRLAGTVMHRVDLGPDAGPTRDIMEAAFEKAGRRFTVLVNHWPSKRGGAQESEPRRIAAATVAAGIVDSLTALDPRADVVVMGDFNDLPSSRPVVETLGAREYRSGSSFEGRLINTARPVEEADTIGSYFFDGAWETIDQIMLSRGALDGAGIVLNAGAERVFAPDFLRDDVADPVFRPPHRTYRGSQYVGGTSDHFPVYLVTEWKGGD
jgi:predicted extracellular nuclease